jgi:hypothetical protein
MASILHPHFSEPWPGASDWEKENAGRLRWLALALVLIGVGWRFARYLLRFPVWGDEAMLLVNYFSKGYLDLLGSIDNCQVAPILFHWIELTAVRWLGTSELAVRLPAFLACLGSLALFWRLARLTLPPLGHAFAVGILSVSIWPATMGSLTKPYAFDLFFSLALLVPAVTWLARPERLAPLVVLVLVVPIAIASSYPSVFIAGAIGLVLVPTVWRTRGLRTLSLFGLYAFLLIGTFFVHYWFVSVPHMASSIQDTNTITSMRQYWGEGFLPSLGKPLQVVKWLLLAHTGQIAAYPLGAASGGSIVTVAMSLVGLVWLWRRGQTRLVLLVLAAFGLWFVAGALRKYPYGASCRLAQHVAPFYCLLAGLGVAVLVLRVREERVRWRTALQVLGVLALIGIGGTVRDFLKPYRDEDARWARQVVEDLMERAGDDPVLVAQEDRAIIAVLQWQLRGHGAHPLSDPDIAWPRPARMCSSLWVVSYGDLDPVAESGWMQSMLAESGRPWHCVARVPSTLAQSGAKAPFLHWRAYHWVSDRP